MKLFSLYLILSMVTGSPVMTIILLIVIYAFIDKAFIRILPDFLAPLKRNSHIKNLLFQLRANPNNAKALLDVGVLYFETKHYMKALECLKKAAERIDDSARLYLYLGMACIHTGKESEGVEFLHKAITLDKGVGYGLPYIYLLENEMKKKEPQDFESLHGSFERFANTENFNRMGLVYKRIGNKEKAREMFDLSLNSYSYCPRTIKKLHRRWAFSSWFNKVTL